VLGVQTEPNDVSSMKALWFYLLVNKCSETKYGNPYLKITMKVQLTKLKTQPDRSSQKKDVQISLHPNLMNKQIDRGVRCQRAVLLVTSTSIVHTCRT
jgi:hypothetical protein